MSWLVMPSSARCSGLSCSMLPSLGALHFQLYWGRAEETKGPVSWLGSVCRLQNSESVHGVLDVSTSAVRHEYLTVDSRVFLHLRRPMDHHHLLFPWAAEGHSAQAAF